MLSIFLVIECELGGQENIITLAGIKSFNPFTNDLFAVTIDVGRIPNRRPEECA